VCRLQKSSGSENKEYEIGNITSGNVADGTKHRIRNARIKIIAFKKAFKRKREYRRQIIL